MPNQRGIRRANMHSDQAEHRISRRKMLKRIGAGAAVAWSSPVLTSIRTPAFAASGGGLCGPDQGCGGRCATLNGSTGCLDAPSSSVGLCNCGLECFDGLTTEGVCQNFQNTFCGCCVTPCTNSSDCPPGQQCLCSQNGCGMSICLSCCGANCCFDCGSEQPK